MSTLVTEEEVAFVPAEASASAISWSAIAAGGIAAAGFSLFLIELGAGIGLSVASPWSSMPSGTTISILAGISICLISIMASGLGGFIAGRLRTRVVGVHSDETYFRDSAHGFLAWAFAAVLGALVAALAATSLASGTVAGAAANPSIGSATSYYTDMLFRSDRPAPEGQQLQAANDDIGRIVARATVRNGTLSPADRTYLAQRVASRTGLSQQEAESRVDTVINQAKTAADDARKAAAKAAFWMAAAMLCGALAAAFAAAEGGRERDA